MLRIGNNHATPAHDFHWSNHSRVRIFWFLLARHLLLLNNLSTLHFWIRFVSFPYIRSLVIKSPPSCTSSQLDSTPICLILTPAIIHAFLPAYMNDAQRRPLQLASHSHSDVCTSHLHVQCTYAYTLTRIYRYTYTYTRTHVVLLLNQYDAYIHT